MSPIRPVCTALLLALAGQAHAASPDTDLHDVHAADRARATERFALADRPAAPATHTRPGTAPAAHPAAAPTHAAPPAARPAARPAAPPAARPAPPPARPAAPTHTAPASPSARPSAPVHTAPAPSSTQRDRPAPAPTHRPATAPSHAAPAHAAPAPYHRPATAPAPYHRPASPAPYHRPASPAPYHRPAYGPDRDHAPAPYHRPAYGPRPYYPEREVYVYHHVRPYHGVIVYGPRPEYHHSYVGRSEVKVKEAQLPTRAVDRTQSVAVGLKGGSIIGGYDTAAPFADPGVGAMVRWRPAESVGLEGTISQYGMQSSDSTRSNTAGSASVELFAYPWTRVSPYVLAGLTADGRDFNDAYYDTSTGTVANNTVSDVQWGPHAGLGVEFAIGKSLAIDVEGRYIGFMNTSPTDPTLPGALQTSIGVLAHF